MPPPAAVRRLAVLLALSAVGHLLFLSLPWEPESGLSASGTPLSARLGLEAFSTTSAALADSASEAPAPAPAANADAPPLHPPAFPVVSTAPVALPGEGAAPALPEGGRALSPAERRVLALIELAVNSELPAGLAVGRTRFLWEDGRVRQLGNTAVADENVAEMERDLSAAAARLPERLPAGDSIEFEVVE